MGKAEYRSYQRDETVAMQTIYVVTEEQDYLAWRSRWSETSSVTRPDRAWKVSWAGKPGNRPRGTDVERLYSAMDADPNYTLVAALDFETTPEDDEHMRVSVVPWEAIKLISSLGLDKLVEVS